MLLVLGMTFQSGCCRYSARIDLSDRVRHYALIIRKIGCMVAEEKFSNVVRLSDEAFAAVKRESDFKKSSTGSAATFLVMRGEHRTRALQRYYDRIVSGDIVPASLAERAKTRKEIAKVKVKVRREAAKKEAAMLAKQKAKETAKKKLARLRKPKPKPKARMKKSKHAHAMNGHSAPTFETVDG